MATYNTYTSAATNSIKENILDLISRLNPYDMHLWRSLPKGPCTQTQFQWLEDSLATPTSNAAVDGADATAQTLTGQSILSNYTQILEKTFKVSGTIDVTDQYGKNRESGYQMRKNATELLNDTEWSLLQQASATGAAATARKMNGAITQTSTNVQGHTAAAVLSAEDTALEVVYNDMLQTIFTAGGQPTKTYVGGFQKRRFSTFSTRVTRNVNAVTRKMVTAINVYDADFGTQEIVPHRIMPTNKAFIMDPTRWKIRVLRPIKTTKLGKLGDSETWQMLHELTLEGRNESANGVLTALVTAVA